VLQLGLQHGWYKVDCMDAYQWWHFAVGMSVVLMQLLLLLSLLGVAAG
jgi:hypothetical protein